MIPARITVEYPLVNVFVLIIDILDSLIALVTIFS